MNLVTGATGFIGARLFSPGDRGLVRGKGMLPGQVTGDLLDLASLHAVCGGVESVYHCAGYAHAFASSDPDIHWRVNYQGTCNLLMAAGTAGVKNFVYLSSVKAGPEPGGQCGSEASPGMPVTEYGRSKHAAEAAVLEAGSRYGMHVVVLRPAMVYGYGGKGNLERMARGIQAGWFPPLPETGNMRSILHVIDLIKAMRLVEKNPAANGKIYIVADGSPYSSRVLYDEIRKSLKLPPLSWAVPVGLLRAGGWCGDMAGRLLGRDMPLNSEVLERLLGDACYSPCRIEHDLGWKSQVTLAEGLQEMLYGAKQTSSGH